MRTQITTASELKNVVSEWVNTFNYIQLEVLEKMADDSLFEYIKQPRVDYDEFLNNYSLWDDYKEWLTENEQEDTEENKQEFSEEQNEFERFQDDRSSGNYPMWNTCFEFKSEESEEVIEAAEKAGFGIIQGLDPFNSVLFVSGCGYSFYGAHWIPLFLELPWNSDIKQRVNELNIKYDNQ